MARVTYSPIVSNISGSVGSCTFRNDRGGGILYNRPLPSRRASESQLYHRSLIKASAAAWVALDEDIRRSWVTFAESEQIPSFFSRGRRWRGKDLFTCFFLYAEHQLTPLPARWLPTPPLFFNAPYITWLIGYPWTPPDYKTACLFMAWNPTDLNPSFPGGYTTAICNSFFAGYVPFGSRKIPRHFVKIAPALPSANQYFSTPPAHYTGFAYEGWQPMLDTTIAVPPGLPFPTVAPIPSPYSLAVARFSVTDSRLYYTPITWGDPHHDQFGSYSISSFVNNTTALSNPYVHAWGTPQDIPTTEY